ncbi:MAG TPA: DUF981 family protein [Thermoplasmata archaeon]|jgi:uncharacterized membrane protein|nr:DUF981 family protein [Thermoplasmata archaeon]
MAFVDDLGFVVALILAGAAVLAWTSVKAFLAMYQNNPTKLRATLKSSAVPVGIIGAIAAAVGLDIEFTWPFPASFNLASYNILFGDALMLFAMVTIIYAVVAFYGLKLEYAGVFGFVAGVMTAWYGYWGYTTLVKPGVLGLTKDPLETFLLYGAFAAAGVFSLPAALAVDWFLEHPGATWTPISLSIRPAKEPTADDTKESRFRLPAYVYVLVVWFPIFVTLAAIAAWFYMGDILPGHLTSAP